MAGVGADRLLPLKRPICSSCERPARTCLCAAMPPRPIRLSGHVLVLRHPNERKKPLATVPVLSKCLEGMTVLHSRKLKGGINAHFDDVLQLASNGTIPLYLLYPGPDAVPLDKLPSPSVLEQQRQPAPIASTSTSSDPSSVMTTVHDSQPAYVLLVVDGTWREAKEMWRSVSSQLLQPEGPGIQVTLPLAGQPSLPASPSGGAHGTAGAAQRREGQAHERQQDSSVRTSDGLCLIRKEPVVGYMLTYEAICHALATLEGGGQELLDVLLQPLRAMTRYQAQHDPAVAARCGWAVARTPLQEA